MITEPEMWDEPGAVGPADLLSDDDGPPAGGTAANRRKWVWALGGVLAASAVWTAVLHGTDYGHRPAPALHGFHLTDDPCGGINLKPLTDAMKSSTYQASPADLRRGRALDTAACTLTTMTPVGDGWTTTYSISLSVELHKKTDPRVEFEDRNRLTLASLRDPAPAGLYAGVNTADRVQPVRGLGDSAYLLSAGNSDKTLNVIRGGAVLSLQVGSYSDWTGPGVPPVAADGFPHRPAPTDLSSALRAAMLHLMDVLSS